MKSEKEKMLSGQIGSNVFFGPGAQIFGFMTAE